jgi:predicted membrane protein
MYTISWILLAIILIVFIYTGIYGCGCGDNNQEKFETKEYRFDTEAVKNIKKTINDSIF